MEDKELLELAAKAAGINMDSWEDCGWSPLSDDGDALRLAVKLGLRFEHHLSHPYVAVFVPKIVGRFEEEYNDDPYAATRRAIVRAAAEVGRGME